MGENEQTAAVDVGSTTMLSEEAPQRSGAAAARPKQTTRGCSVPDACLLISHPCAIPARASPTSALASTSSLARRGRGRRPRCGCSQLRYRSPYYLDVSRILNRVSRSLQSPLPPPPFAQLISSPAIASPTAPTTAAPSSRHLQLPPATCPARLDVGSSSPRRTPGLHDAHTRPPPLDACSTFASFRWRPRPPFASNGDGRNALGPEKAGCGPDCGGDVLASRVRCGMHLACQIHRLLSLQEFENIHFGRLDVQLVGPICTLSPPSCLTSAAVLFFVLCPTPRTLTPNLSIL